MSRILNVASVAAVGMTAATMLLLAEPGFASDLAADASLPAITLPGADAPEAQKADLPTAAELPVEEPSDLQDEVAPETEIAPPVTAASLAALVAATPKPAATTASPSPLPTRNPRRWYAQLYVQVLVAIVVLTALGLTHLHQGEVYFLLLVAALMTPALVKLVVRRRFPALQSRHQASVWLSLWWSLRATASRMRFW